MKNKNDSQKKNTPMPSRTLKIQIKLLAAFLVFSLLPFSVIGIIAVNQSNKSLSNLAFGQLTNIRDIKKAQLERFFNEKRTEMDLLAKTVDALKQSAFNKLTTVQENKKAQIIDYFSMITGELIVLSKNASVVRALADFKLIADNGEIDFELYDFFEKDKYKNFFQEFNKEFGFYDLLLVSKNGDVVYSVNRESELGKNLLSDDEFNDGIAGCFQKSLQNVTIEDFEPYPPSNGRYIAFLGAPVKEKYDRVAGAVIIKITNKAVNAIAGRREGMGRTGESFIIGRKDGVDALRTNRIITSEMIGELKIDSFFDKVMEGDVAPLIKYGRNGGMEIGGYNVLPVPNLKWILASTMDLKEVIAPKLEKTNDNFFSRFQKKSDYHNIFLISSTGDIFFAVHPGPEYRTNLVEGKYLKTGLGILFKRIMEKKEFSFVDYSAYPPMQNEPVAFLGSPIFKNNEIELVAAAALTPGPVNAVMNRSEKNGETYLVGPDKILRSNADMTIFKGNLKKCFINKEACRINAEAVQNALNGLTGEAVTINYMQKQVLSAYTPVDVLGVRWALMSEMNSAHAFSAVSTFKFIAFAVAVVFLILIIFFSSLTARNITKPVSQLMDASEQLKNRNFNISLEVKSNDEFETLAKTFNAMVEEIRTYSGDLEQKVDLLKKAENEIKKNEKQLSAIINNAKAVIYLKDLDGKFMLVNNRYEEIFKIKNEEVTGFTDYDFFPKKNADAFRKNDLQVIEKNKAVEWEEKVPQDDGIHTYISIKFPLWDEQGRPYAVCGISTDITDRIKNEKENMKLEAQLRNAQKMEAVGTLAGGIAHDFNNILGIILGNTELAMEKMSEWNAGYNNLKEIKTASLRARDVVKQLLSFSRKTILEMKPVNIAPIVRESIILMRASIPANIFIEHNIPERCGNILAEATQIHQVIINLCTNAAHAMEENGGLLTIDLSETSAADVWDADLSEYDQSSFIRLLVADTGCGIHEDIRERIFDPYFTTKDTGKGSGMGLAVVNGIVEKFKGKIAVESEAGKGTTITLYFPVIEETQKVESAKTQAVPKGNEKILLIDDEKSLVDTGKKLLENLGYYVETRTNPLEALELITEDPYMFDLVITDMTMPQMMGDTLIREIKRYRYDMPIILCSGYSERIDDALFKETGIRKFIEKPLMKNELARAVREALKP